MSKWKRMTHVMHRIRVISEVIHDICIELSVIIHRNMCNDKKLKKKKRYMHRSYVYIDFIDFLRSTKSFTYYIVEICQSEREENTCNKWSYYNICIETGFIIHKNRCNGKEKNDTYAQVIHVYWFYPNIRRTKNSTYHIVDIHRNKCYYT